MQIATLLTKTDVSGLIVANSRMVTSRDFTTITVRDLTSRILLAYSKRIKTPEKFCQSAQRTALTLKTILADESTNEVI